MTFIDESLQSWTPLVIDTQLIEWSHAKEKEMDERQHLHEHARLIFENDGLQRKLAQAQNAILFLACCISAGEKSEDGSVKIVFSKDDVRVFTDTFESIRG